MQLILSIDDIVNKKNMSSVEETIENEKEVKNPLLDKILSYSASCIADNSTNKQDDIAQDSPKSNEVCATNGSVTDEHTPSTDELDESEDCSKIESANREYGNHVELNFKKEHDNIEISKEIKTGCAEEAFQEKTEESKEIESERICDKNDDDDCTIKSDVQDENESHIKKIDCKKDEVENLKENVEDISLKDIDDISSKDVDDCQIENVEEICSKDINDSQIEKMDVICNEDENGIQDLDTEQKEDIAEEVSNKEVGSKHINDSQLEKMDVICKEDEDENGIHDVDTEQKEDIAEEVSNDIIQESQLEDFESDCNENGMPENAINDLLENMEDNKNEHLSKDSEDNENKKNSNHKEPVCSISEEIIDIADEKDCSDSSENNEQQDNKLVENIPLDTDSSDESPEKSTEDLSKSHIEQDDLKVPDKVVESPASDKSNHSLIVAPSDAQNKDNINETKLNPNPVENVDSTKKVMNFKLSNTLNILSDDEDSNTTAETDSSKIDTKTEESEKQCINIEDDDDIMLIDDESITKENKIIENDIARTKSESIDVAEVTEVQVENKQDNNENVIKNLQKNDLGLEDSAKMKEEIDEKPKSEEKPVEKSPLLASNSLKSFKKNLAEMTREELEDFCILKIVESVFDKSNLGEIKAQMKAMAQNIEEYKAKAKVLTKQNRDLQVVLKSVQEEQKKNSSAITPLKITRSVGMQVLMTDKNSRKRQSILSTQNLLTTNNSPNTVNTNNKTPNKSQVNPNTRAVKPQQPIPVPRLVPAVNVTTKPSPNASPQNINTPGKSSTVNNTPNGIKHTPPPPLPPTKPEKRTHSKMQQNNSDTVDLTDDEPPTKVNNRNNSTVRCVPSQSLLASQRSPLPQTLISPKKVYIPINGPQMPAQMKAVPAQGPRPRGPAPGIKNLGNNTSIRASRVAQRHPAPLPDFMKQYQPPNWKALPPAPELKLAKVENGIVISWKIDGYREENHEEIASYQLFAYQETSSPPNTSLWKKIGDVKALPLPMACTLTQFMSGYKYYFAVRAVDVRSRFGPFSLPGSILLLKNQ